jgi:hypothetical protein
MVKEAHLPLLGIELRSIQQRDYNLVIILSGLEERGLFVGPFSPHIVSTADDITIKQMQFASSPHWSLVRLLFMLEVSVNLF